MIYCPICGGAIAETHCQVRLVERHEGQGCGFEVTCTRWHLVRIEEEPGEAVEQSNA